MKTLLASCPHNYIRKINTSHHLILSLKNFRTVSILFNILFLLQISPIFLFSHSFNKYLLNLYNMQSYKQLHIDVKRRQLKGKGGSERYTHLKAEFQETVREDKKVFLNEQCKGTEENKRMGKTRDLFQKAGDTKGTFHAKMGTIKDRNGMDLTEAKDIKKRWQEYTELYKKCLNTQITTMV